jgi:bifunctional non-homologous end joining protein LigD
MAILCRPLYEIKHDEFRVIARKDGEGVRFYSRPGNDLTYRFPLIVEALARPRSRSCIIDGKPSLVAMTTCRASIASANRRHDADVFLYVFDLSREPLDVRKATLASVLARAAPGLRLNQHIEADGPTVFAHACRPLAGLA